MPNGGTEGRGGQIPEPNGSSCVVAALTASLPLALGRSFSAQPQSQKPGLHAAAEHLVEGDPLELREDGEGPVRRKGRQRVDLEEYGPPLAIEAEIRPGEVPAVEGFEGPNE